MVAVVEKGRNYLTLNFILIFKTIKSWPTMVCLLKIGFAPMVRQGRNTITRNTSRHDYPCFCF